MDFLEKFRELQLKKVEIETQMEQVVIDWVHSHNINEGDKFVFTDGVYIGKQGQLGKGRYYKVLKKDGTPNESLGWKSFWLYDMKFTKIEKI